MSMHESSRMQVDAWFDESCTVIAMFCQAQINYSNTKDTLNY